MSGGSCNPSGTLRETDTWTRSPELWRSSVGHCHLYVTERLQQQVGRLQHTTTLYVYRELGALAEQLAQRMPAASELSVSYMTNSGSEANEVAILTSRQYTGHSDVISLRGG